MVDCFGGIFATETYVNDKFINLETDVQSWIPPGVYSEGQAIATEAYVTAITSSLQNEIDGLQQEVAALRLQLSALQSVCGNGLVEPGEECDDGNNNGNSACTITYTFKSPGEPFCGDDVVNAGEECDDGNNKDGDGCSAACKNELTSSCTSENAECEVNGTVGKCDSNGLCVFSRSFARPTQAYMEKGLMTILDILNQEAPSPCQAKGRESPSEHSTMMSPTLSLARIGVMSACTN